MSWKSILHDGRWLRVYVYVRYNSQDENKRVETVSLCVYSILNLFNSSIYYGACQNNDHMRCWVFFNHSEMSTWSSNGLYFDFQRDVLDVKKSIWTFNQQVWSLSSQNGWRFVFSEDRNGMELFFYEGRLNTTTDYYYTVFCWREANAGSLDGSAGFCFKDPMRMLMCTVVRQQDESLVAEDCDVAWTDEPCRRSALSEVLANSTTELNELA